MAVCENTVELKDLTMNIVFLCKVIETNNSEAEQKQENNDAGSDDISSEEIISSRGPRCDSSRYSKRSNLSSGNLRPF